MSDDRRHSFRCAVVDADVATLVVGRRRLPVTMLDESREGFAVVARQAPGIEPGQTVWLQRAASRTLVRLIDVQQQEGGVRLGLSRMEEELASSSGKSAFYRWLCEDPRGEPAGQQRTQFGVWTLLIVAIAVGFVAWHCGAR